MDSTRNQESPLSTSTIESAQHLFFAVKDFTTFGFHRVCEKALGLISIISLGSIRSIEEAYQEQKRVANHDWQKYSIHRMGIHNHPLANSKLIALNRNVRSGYPAELLKSESPHPETTPSYFSVAQVVYSILGILTPPLRWALKGGIGSFVTSLTQTLDPEFNGLVAEKRGKRIDFQSTITKKLGEIRTQISEIDCKEEHSHFKQDSVNFLNALEGLKQECLALYDQQFEIIASRSEKENTSDGRVSVFADEFKGFFQTQTNQFELKIVEMVNAYLCIIQKKTLLHKAIENLKSPQPAERTIGFHTISLRENALKPTFAYDQSIDLVLSTHIEKAKKQVLTAKKVKEELLHTVNNAWAHLLNAYKNFYDRCPETTKFKFQCEWYQVQADFSEKIMDAGSVADVNQALNQATRTIRRWSPNMVQSLWNRFSLISFVSHVKRMPPSQKLYILGGAGYSLYHFGFYPTLMISLGHAYSPFRKVCETALPILLTYPYIVSVGDVILWSTLGARPLGEVDKVFSFLGSFKPIIPVVFAVSQVPEARALMMAISDQATDFSLRFGARIGTNTTPVLPPPTSML